MSQTEVERLLGRLMTDAEFRGRAATSLESVCYREGMGLSTQELSFLALLDFSQFGPIGELLDDSIRRK